MQVYDLVFSELIPLFKTCKRQEYNIVPFFTKLAGYDSIERASRTVCTHQSNQPPKYLPLLVDWAHITLYKLLLLSWIIEKCRSRMPTNPLNQFLLIGLSYLALKFLLEKGKIICFHLRYRFLS